MDTFAIDRVRQFPFRGMTELQFGPLSPRATSPCSRNRSRHSFFQTHNRDPFAFIGAYLYLAALHHQQLLAAQVSMIHAPHSRLAAAIILLAPALAGCAQNQPAAGGPPPPTVSVARPIERGITDQEEYVGRF